MVFGFLVFGFFSFGIKWGFFFFRLSFILFIHLFLFFLGLFYEVKGVLDLGERLHMIQLEEIDGPPVIDL